MRFCTSLIFIADAAHHIDAVCALSKLLAEQSFIRVQCPAFTVEDIVTHDAEHLLKLKKTELPSAGVERFAKNSLF